MLNFNLYKKIIIKKYTHTTVKKISKIKQKKFQNRSILVQKIIFSPPLNSFLKKIK
jgi:hypothetical protein